MAAARRGARMTRLWHTTPPTAPVVTVPTSAPASMTREYASAVPVFRTAFAVTATDATAHSSVAPLIPKP